jgi:LacI family transcriptional regulator, xylobiose transport system transcriptional regulator
MSWPARSSTPRPASGRVSTGPAPPIGGRGPEVQLPYTSPVSAVPAESTDAGRQRREVTVAQIARIAGVSAATVSKVINGYPGVAAGTRLRVEEIMNERGYRRQEYGAPAAILELVFLALDSLWALEILQGAEEVAQRNRLAAAVTDMKGRYAPGPSWSEQVVSRRPVAVIAVSVELSPAQRRQLHSRNIPLVVLDPSGEPAHQVPSIGATNWNGGLAAARHLLELGHRRIAMINGPEELLCCRARLDGYRAAMDAARAPVDPALLRAGPLNVDGGLVAGRALLATPDRPTAVFAANDLQALGVYEAARRAGLRIPEDLSVVGFDDLPLAQWCGPALTTVRQPLRQMGAAAANTALIQAAGEQPEYSRIELPTTLVVRDSTAAPPPAGLG